MKKLKSYGPGYFASRLALIALLLLTFLPFIMMINMSMKPTVLISTDFLGLPNPPYWKNFENAMKFVGRPILNSLFICGSALMCILVNVILSGYTFARLRFKGKKFLYSAIVAVMMVPVTVTIVPQYLVVSELGIVNTYAALILPYIASQQVIGIILARTTIEQMPLELFDAAKIDGASELQTMIRIALPLLKPTLITAGIQAVVAMYNDYIWPTVALTGGDEMKTFCQIVYNNSQGYVRTDIGQLCAAFILGTVPLVVITCCCLKYYLQGMVAGAVKG